MIDCLLVTSIDGYVTVIELDSILMKVEREQEILINQEFQNRCKFSSFNNNDNNELTNTAITNKNKRKRSKKEKSLTDAAQTSAITTNSESENETIRLVETSPRILTDSQREELLTLASAGIRLNGELVANKFEVGRNKAQRLSLIHISEPTRPY